jgi:hypothetical protein
VVLAGVAQQLPLCSTQLTSCQQEQSSFQQVKRYRTVTAHGKAVAKMFLVEQLLEASLVYLLEEMDVPQPEAQQVVALLGFLSRVAKHRPQLGLLKGKQGLLKIQVIVLALFVFLQPATGQVSPKTNAKSSAGSFWQGRISLEGIQETKEVKK